MARRTRSAAAAYLLVLLASVASVACRDAGERGAAPTDDAATTGRAADSVTVVVDGARVTPDQSAVMGDVTALLPASVRDPSRWLRVTARAKDGRSMTVEQPAVRYPGARFELRTSRGGDGPTLWLVTSTTGGADSPITSLPGVVEVRVDTKAARRDAGPPRKAPTLTLRIGAKSIPLAWPSLEGTKRARPRGVKMSGYRVRDVIAPHVLVARIRRVVLVSPSERYELSGHALRGPRDEALLRLNRRGLIRFRHYRLPPTSAPKHATKDVGGLRDVQSIEIRLAE